jgi:hypothetical protein
MIIFEPGTLLSTRLHASIVSGVIFDTRFVEPNVMYPLLRAGSGPTAGFSSGAR